MANTTDDKLDLLKATKEDFKAAFSECGHVVSEVFATYPDVVREIGKGGGTSNVSVNPNQWFVNGVSSISIMYQNPDGNSENRLVKENSSFSIQVMKGSLVAISVYAYSQSGGYFYPSVNGSSLSTTLIANPDRYTRITSTQFIADGDTMTVT